MTASYRRPVVALWMVAALAAPAAHAGFITNGSLEDTQGRWSNTLCGYKAVAAGSGDIGGWTVGSGATGPVAWGRSTTCDGQAASAGDYFVDLSGFGANAGPASLDQVVQNLIAGQSYDISLDYQGVAPGVFVGGNALALQSSGSGGWLHLSGRFVATAGAAVLSLKNVAPGALIVFVDNVSITDAGTGTVPEPASWALAGLALAGAALARLRR